jgi:hypothetical protein
VTADEPSIEELHRPHRPLAEVVDDETTSLSPTGSRPPLLARLSLDVVSAMSLILAVAVASAVGLVGSDAPPEPIAFGVPTPGPNPIVQPPATPTPQPEPEPCGTGGVALGVTFGDPGIEIGQLQAPEIGRIAMVLRTSDDNAAIVVAGPGSVPPRSVAIAKGLTGIQLQDPVGVVAWSADGRELLIRSEQVSGPSEMRLCRNLFVVAADGSSAALMTDGTVDGYATGGYLSHDGSLVAFGDAELLAIRTVAEQKGLGYIDECPGLSDAAWAPDDRELVAVCNGAVMDVSLGSEVRHTTYQPPPGLIVVAATIVDGHIVAATLPPQASQDRLAFWEWQDGAWAPLVAADVSTEWVLGAPTFSPDGRWLLIQGDGYGTQNPFPTYAVEVATGHARRVPVPIFEGEGPLSWFDGSTVAKALDRTLYAVNLEAMEVSARGTVPTDDVAYSPVVPGS